MDIVTMFAVVVKFIMRLVDLIKGFFNGDKDGESAPLAQIN